MRSPIERPTSSFSISRAIRRRVAGAPARSRHSSLRSHAENKIPPSAIPLGKTSGCSPSASYACKLSFLTRRTPASPRLKRLMRTDAKTLTRWPRESSGRSCATEAGRRKPRSRRRTTDSRRCRDGTSCRTSASDSQRSSEEAGSPASEEARGCKRRRDLRTQPAVLSRQGRLNEVCCLR